MKKILLTCVLLLLVSCGTPSPAAQPSPTTQTESAVEPTAVVAEVAPTAAPADPVAVPAEPAAVRVFEIDSAQSSAAYAVEEIFFSDNRLFTAVGVTNAVEGAFEVTSNGKPSGKVTRMGTFHCMRQSARLACSSCPSAHSAQGPPWIRKPNKAWRPLLHPAEQPCTRIRVTRSESPAPSHPIRVICSES